ncbi:C3HC4 type (RING finger) domain-containing protein [Hexamita inflata]|uniref:C3HC4 type (RING finger) domain-containing protein n=1 Tax=Hexamita inflata TaxID=28002 RepID=A0ABP1HBM2_9EUKA
MSQICYLCEQKNELLCLQCGHSLCNQCLASLQASQKYFKCPQCKQYIVQKPVSNIQLNALICSLPSNYVVQNKHKCTATDKYLFETQLQLKLNFQPVQVSFDGRLVIIQSSHKQYPDYLSFKFVSSTDLYLQLQFANSIKTYNIERKIEFNGEQQICIPVGPVSKLFFNNESTLKISISKHCFAVCAILTSLRLNLTKINSFQKQINELSDENCLQFLRELLQIEGARTVFNTETFQFTVQKCNLLMKTIDYKMIGKQLDFDYLSQIVKNVNKWDEMWPEDYAEEQKIMHTEDHKGQMLRIKAFKEKQTEIKNKEDQLKKYSKKLVMYVKVAEHSINTLKNENMNLNQKIHITHEMLMKFDLINTPLASLNKEYAHEEHIGLKSNFYTNNMVFYPTDIKSIVKYNQNKYKIIVPLELDNKKVRITIYPKDGQKLLNKWFQFTTTFGCVQSNKICYDLVVWLADSNFVIID